MFGLLNIVAWTSFGPFARSSSSTWPLRARTAGIPLQVTGVDKIPRATDYVVLPGCPHRRRLRCGWAPTSPPAPRRCTRASATSTGTLGACMVEGRISAGVVVDEASDVGGGASIMGTMSGGGTVRITVGKRCLIGANAGIGIRWATTASSRPAATSRRGARALDRWSVVKARELSGRPGLLFWRNSQTGASRRSCERRCERSSIPSCTPSLEESQRSLPQLTSSFRPSLSITLFHSAIC